MTASVIGMIMAAPTPLVTRAANITSAEGLQHVGVGRIRVLRCEERGADRVERHASAQPINHRRVHGKDPVDNLVEPDPPVITLCRELAHDRRVGVRETHALDAFAARRAHPAQGGLAE